MEMSGKGQTWGLYPVVIKLYPLLVGTVNSFIHVASFQTIFTLVVYTGHYNFEANQVFPNC